MFDPKELAAQLRKPKGETGEKVAGFMSKGNSNFYQSLLLELKEDTYESVVEVGMGAGNHVQKLIDAIRVSKYLGVDYSEDMVQLAASVNAGVDSASFVTGDAKQMPCDSGIADLLLTINTIYFFDELSDCFDEYYRVIKQGGLLVIGYRDKDDLDKLSQVTQHGFVKRTRDEVVRAITNAGFQLNREVRSNDPEMEFREDNNLRLSSNLIFARKV